ncbi:MAG: type II toxin-antitoxin system VapB family antitoxin [Granulosicoccus sp.]
MRATVTLDDAKVANAKERTGITDTASLMREALDALIQREASHRLAALGGTMPDLETTPRRRPPDSENSDLEITK